MKLSFGQKQKLKGMIVPLITNTALLLLASALLRYPWSHTFVIIALSIAIAIIYAVVIVFRHKEDE